MKRLILIFIAISLNVCFAQTINFPIPDDFCSGSTSSSGFTMTSATSSTNGWVRSSKGELHALALFIAKQFYKKNY